MAQTGYTPIQLYYSSTTTNAPLAANLAYGELAINITDGKLFYKDNADAIQVIAWKVTPTSAGGTGLTSYTAGDMVYYASGTALSKLGIGTADYVMTSSGTAPQWSQFLKAKAGGTGQTSYAVGDLLYADTTTTLAKLADVATGNALISGGVNTAPAWGKIGLTTHVSGTLPTANGGTGLTSFTSTGVLYASSTSALATSSNFTFDGTNVYAANIVAIGGSPLAGTKLDVYQDLGGIGDAAYFKDTGSGYGAGAVYIRFVNNAGSTAGSIQHTASTTTNYNTASDARLKTDKGVATDTSVIDNLVIHDYEWKEDGRIDRGVFAQEAHLVKPSAIAVGDDQINSEGVLLNPWCVDYSKFVPDLIVYCQQLNAKIQALEAKLKNSGVSGF